jgi:hypothetical protein
MSDGSSCDPLLFDHFCFDNFNNKTKKANVYQIKIKRLCVAGTNQEVLESQ